MRQGDPMGVCVYILLQTQTYLLWDSQGLPPSPEVLHALLLASWGPHSHLGLHSTACTLTITIAHLPFGHFQSSGGRGKEGGQPTLLLGHMVHGHVATVMF